MSRRYSSFIAFALIASVATSAQAAEAGAGWLRTAVNNALNPKISAIGDFVAQFGPGESNDLSIRETEVAIQSEVDPNTRADFYFALHDGESFELEEAYITMLSLPFGFQARGGKFFSNFGRLNMVHTHELPQVDRPQALVDYLGEEGINSTGFELSRVFTPFGTFVEATYGFMENLGEAHHHGEEAPETTVITDDNGDPVTVALFEEPEAADPNSHLRDFANVGRLRIFRDLSDATNVELGASAAHYEPTGLESKTLGGVDFTFRWKPQRAGLNRSLIWRTEVLKSRVRTPSEVDDTGTLVADKATYQRSAGYSYLEVQPARAWRVGVRGDYVETIEGAQEVTKAVSPYVTFYATEFNRYRVQYRYRDLPQGERDHTGFLQWTVVIGPHGAHAY